MNKEEKEMTIKDFLEAFNAKSIDELPDEMIVGVLSLITEPRYGGATTIYEESNESERDQFIKDAKRCINGEVEIEYRFVNNEGVKTEDNEDYFEWISRHSVWYETITTL